MSDDCDKRCRRSIRLKEYDYSQSGAYFVTICGKNRKCLFGEVVDREIRLNQLSRIIAACWNEIPRHFTNIELDAFVVMPNHVHGIVVIVDAGGRGTACRAPTMEQFGKPVANSLPTIVRSFKSATTKRINEIRSTPAASVWQRNYYEHVIRDEESLNRIREYISTNPLRWHLDRENRDKICKDEFDVWFEREFEAKSKLRSN